MFWNLHYSLLNTHSSSPGGYPNVSLLIDTTIISLLLSILVTYNYQVAIFLHINGYLFLIFLFCLISFVHKCFCIFTPCLTLFFSSTLFFKNHILLIMQLQLSQSFPICLPAPGTPLPSSNSPT